MNKFNILLLIAALYLTGCTTARIALTDPVWQSNTGYPVEGRTQTVFQKKPLRFAEFFTTSVQTSWKKSSSVATDIDGRMVSHRYNNTIGMLYEQSKSSRRFKMSNGEGRESEVYTFNRLNSSSVTIGKSLKLNFNRLFKLLGISNRDENSYYVQVFEPGVNKPWELLLDMDAVEMNPRNYIGYFALTDNDYFTIRPIRHMMGRNGPSALPIGVVGYEIADADGKPVAAVSLFDKGSVYMVDGLSKADRFLMANLCAALLFFEQS